MLAHLKITTYLWKWPPSKCWLLLVSLVLHWPAPAERCAEENRVHRFVVFFFKVMPDSRASFYLSLFLNGCFVVVVVVGLFCSLNHSDQDHLGWITFLLTFSSDPCVSLYVYMGPISGSQCFYVSDIVCHSHPHDGSVVRLPMFEGIWLVYNLYYNTNSEWNKLGKHLIW